MINIQNLHKRYGQTTVLRGLSLDLNQKGITAILGPNGSGKTTLLKCILGLVIPDEGKILFNQTPIRGKHLYRHYISQVAQIAQFPENLSVHELLQMAKDLRPGPTSDEHLITLFELEKELHKKMRNLSSGNRQKVNLLLGLMYDNPVTILDEPSNGLDPVSYLNLKKFLREEATKNKQILVTTHIMSFVEEMADHIVFILDGKIHFKGSLSELIEMQGGGNLEEAIASILKPAP